MHKNGILYNSEKRSSFANLHVVFPFKNSHFNIPETHKTHHTKYRPIAVILHVLFLQGLDILNETFILYELLYYLIYLKKLAINMLSSCDYKR